MIGERYWTTGIVVGYMYANGRHRWSAALKFSDNGFMNDDPANGVVSTEGVLRTRYHLEGDDHVATLAAAVSAVYTDAQRLGIHFDGRRLYADGADSYQVSGSCWLDRAEVAAVIAQVAYTALAEPWAYTTPNSGALRHP